MKSNIQKAAGVAGILMTLGLGTFSGWMFNYHDKFSIKADLTEYKENVKNETILYRKKIQSEKSLTDLDDKIANTVILVTMYELHGLSKLSAEQTATYNRSNARLISLQTRRDSLTGHEIN